jgi:uncharacterized protein (TIGR02145 family)
MKKKTSILIYPFIAMGFLLILTYGCKKDDDNILPIQFNPDLSYETTTDIDGNVYRTIKIGTQTWMAENLKVTRYRNGDTIPNVTDRYEWYNLTTGAYCDYENSASNSTVYGKLYNFYAVADSRNIAPTGWHVPSDAEWTTLTTFLGGGIVAGGKLKEKGTAHWPSPNYGATNETGFSALPAGRRGSGGYFCCLGGYAGLWSSTEYDGSCARSQTLNLGYNYLDRNVNYKAHGFSVRCLKD